MKAHYAIFTVTFILGLVTKPAMALDADQYRAIQGVWALWETGVVELTSKYDCLSEAWDSDPENAGKLQYVKMNKKEYYEFKALIEASLKSDIAYQDILAAASNYRRNVEVIENIIGPLPSVHETLCFTDIDWFSRYALKRLNKERRPKNDGSV